MRKYLLFLMLILTGCDATLPVRPDLNTPQTSPNLTDLEDCPNLKKLVDGSLSGLVSYTFDLSKEYEKCSQKHKNLKDFLKIKN